MLKAGIVGLPNVGKSTLFNALTRSRKAEAANYPFCTIDPNVGIVTVPDDAARSRSQKIAKTDVVIPAAIEFVDIAGLVDGAEQGRGSGQQIPRPHPRGGRHRPGRPLLRGRGSSITMGGVDPVRDIEIITPSSSSPTSTPCRSASTRPEEREERRQGGGRPRLALLERLVPHLNAGKPANILAGARGRGEAARSSSSSLTDKPVIFACNVAESDLATADKNPFVLKVAEYVKRAPRRGLRAISAQIESELD